MIYLFTGTDEEKARRKAFEWVEKARMKEPNLAYTRIAKEELSDALLEEVSFSGGIFVKRLLILLDDPFAKVRPDNEEEGAGDSAPDIVTEHLSALGASDNAIIILAPKLAAGKVKKISELAKQSYVFDAPAQAGGMRGFNTGLVNALAARNSERLWLEVVRALRAGDAPEMIHGLLHWKTRDLYAKGSRGWSKGELQKLSLDLIMLLVDARKKGLELGRELERFALSV